MPRPEEVRPAKFPDPLVVFDGTESGHPFAIASGHWEGEHLALACRWNCDDNGSGPGYPKLFGNPTWLVIPNEISIAILTGLLANRPKGTRLDAVMTALTLRVSFPIGAKVKYDGRNEDYKGKVGVVVKVDNGGTGYHVKFGTEIHGPVSPNSLQAV